MTTIIVLNIKTGHQSTQSYQEREEAVNAGKWYLSLKENGVKKYRVVIEKPKQD
jgi:hypothetical protein